MVRFAKILDVAKELAIPDGVRMIIAEYAELTDEERTILAIRQIDDDDFLEVHPLNERTIIVGGSVDADLYIDVRVVARILRKRSWATHRYTHHCTWLAPLWQKAYDVWIAL